MILKEIKNFYLLKIINLPLMAALTAAASLYTALPCTNSRRCLMSVSVVSRERDRYSTCKIFFKIVLNIFKEILIIIV